MGPWALHCLVLVTPTVEVQGCGSAAAVSEQIASMVQPAALESNGGRIAITAEPAGDQWSVVVSMEQGGERWQRHLRAESCEAGLSAAALVAALAIDPDANLGAVVDEEAAPVESEPEPEPPALVTPTRKAAPAPTSRLAWAVDAGVGLGLGVSPRPMGNVRVLGELVGAHASVGVGATYTWPTRVELQPGIGARLEVWTADVRGCYRIVPERAPGLSIPLCGMVRGGAMLGAGRGDSLASRSGRAVWLGVGPVAQARWLSKRRVGAFIAAEAVAVLMRPTFIIESVGRLCCSSRVAGAVIVGVAFGR